MATSVMERGRIVGGLQWLRAGALVVALAQPACGRSSSPTAAPSPASGLASGASLAFVSGESAQGVAGARVTIGDRSYTTDAGGRLVLSQPAAIGAGVTVVAPSYLDRHTRVRDESDRFSLWPRTSPTGLSESITRALVYTPSGCPVTAAAPLVPLRRLAPRATRVSLVPSTELAGDAPARLVHEAAIAVINRIAAGVVRYAIDSAPSGDALRFDLVLLPDHAACDTPTLAVTSVSFGTGGDISGGAIAYCTLGDARNLATVTHELGHTFGLNHSPDLDDLMFCSSASRAAAPSPREELLMSLLLQRRSGNTFPDDDAGERSLAAASETGRVFVCW